MGVTRELGLTDLAISTARKNMIDPVVGDDMLAYCHRMIDTAAIGAKTLPLGRFGPLTVA